MKKIIFIVTIGLFIACSVAKTGSNLMNSEEITMYSIKKIKNEKSFYIIYALRNDSTFKIVSVNTSSVKKPDCENIQVGKSYALDLKVVFALDSLFGKPVAPNLGIKGIIINKEVVKIEEKSHNKIYTALNISGLCVK